VSDASTPERGGTSIGILLREARESRGESLEDAARVTRIGKGCLAALEEDSFDKLPSPAYVRGFLRVYGKHLGLSPDELIQRYERSLAPDPAEGRGESGGGAPPPAVRVAAPIRNRWIVPLVLLVLVLVTATIIPQRDPPPAPPAPKQVPVEALSPPPFVQAPLSSATAGPPPVSREVPTEQQGTNADPAVSAPATAGMVLKLKVNQDCWLNITIDGAVSQQYDLKAGDLIEWKGERFFSLDLGNAGGVEAELNGQALPSFGEVGTTAHVILPAEYSEKQ